MRRILPAQVRALAIAAASPALAAACVHQPGWCKAQRPPPRRPSRLGPPGAQRGGCRRRRLPACARCARRVRGRAGKHRGAAGTGQGISRARIPEVALEISRLAVARFPQSARRSFRWCATCAPTAGTMKPSADWKSSSKHMRAAVPSTGGRRRDGTVLRRINRLITLAILFIPRIAPLVPLDIRRKRHPADAREQFQRGHVRD